MDSTVVVSLKVRVTDGCFHREHSPHAYVLIDRQIDALPRDRGFKLVEHENGPELLVELGIAAASLQIAKTVLDVLIGIIKARSKGVVKGDWPSEPIELIVRRADGTVKEETILRIGAHDALDRGDLERRLNASVQRITGQLPNEGHAG